jgi:hypothetical protein
MIGDWVGTGWHHVFLFAYFSVNLYPPGPIAASPLSMFVQMRSVYLKVCSKREYHDMFVQNSMFVRSMFIQTTIS